MDFLFILDPLPELKAYKDSSVAMMRALARRGHAPYACAPADLWWDAGGTQARAVPLTLRDDDHDWYAAGAAVERPLTAFAASVMRKDPPFDMEYVYATYLLELAEGAGARVFNRPRAVRDHNEKMAIAKFAEFIAPTLVARDPARIGAFIDAHGDAIVKPLDGMGGASVFRVRADDPNRNVIVETVGQHGARTVMVQRFIPAISEGDKRVLVIGGAPVPFALARIPKAGRDARQPRGRRTRRGAPAHRPRACDRRGARAGAVGRGSAGRRPRRHRRLPHRGQRHQPDLLRRDRAADRLRRRRHVRRRPGRRLRGDREVANRRRPARDPPARAARALDDRVLTFPKASASMIGILLIAHDSLPDSLVQAVTHVLGSPPAQLDTLSVAASDDPLRLLPAARERVDRLDTGEGVLIFSDIFGASPCNLACKLIVPGRVEVVAGVNLPMLVRAFTYRSKGLDTMIKKAVSGGCDGVHHVEVDPVYAAPRN